MTDALSQFRVKEWPPERLAAFELLAPVSICVSATDCPVSVALLGRDWQVSEWIGGDPSAWTERTNSPKGCWPAQLDLSWQYADTITRKLRTADSFVRWSLRWRTWMLDADDGATAQALLSIAVRAIDTGHSRLLHGRFDAGPDAWRMHWLCSKRLGALAREMGVRLWSDDELGLVLDRAAVTFGLQRRSVEFQDYVRQMLESDHALSAPVRRPAPRTPTVSGFGIGAKVKPWAGDPDIERQIEAALTKNRVKVA